MKPNPHHAWKPGSDLPYVASIGDGRMLAISLPAAWLKPGPGGEPLLLPPAVRAIDRLRAVFVRQQQITPGFIVSLRQAMNLTQTQFGQKLGVSKMTISRWERGQMRPSATAMTQIKRLQEKAARAGLAITGENRAA